MNAEDFDVAPSVGDKKRSTYAANAPASPAKKQKVDLHVEFEAVHFAGDDADFSEDEDYDPDPAYALSERAAEAFRQRVEEEDEQERRYNVLRVAQQAIGKAKVTRSAAENPRQMTKDEKRDLKLINDKRHGKPMTVEEVKLDVNHMVFIPVRPPDVAEVDRILGVKYKRGKVCFACTRGVGYPLMSGEMIERLERFIDEQIPCTSFMTAALQISYYYHEHIQNPVNQHLMLGERPLPLWPPRQIYEHLTEHIVNPAYRRIHVLRQLRLHSEMLRMSGLYEVDSVLLEQPDRTPALRDMRVNPVYHKMLMETYAQERAFMSLKTEQMSGYNEKMSANTRRTLAPKSNTYHQRQITDFIS